jgi:TolB-like protein/predicted Ser/Thr protein kinase/Tfp pilus assembly protein PilF
MNEKRLSHFRILATLGQGGMGLVYKAEDERLRRTVALKVLLPAFVDDPERRQRFLREARAAAAVTHPTIAAVYEVGEEGSDVFIAMEYVEGQTLRTLLEKGPRPVAEAVGLAVEIARALERAHASGVVHRDLKPENVMVDSDGRARILDFGLAKVRDEMASALSPTLSQADTVPRDPDLLTREGTVVGTAAYMSPEQARGLAVDARSDLFSLGVVLYELLTGRNPFRGPTPVDTLSAVLKDRPRPASDWNAEVPPALDHVLTRLLAKEPGERPPSAADLVRELEALAHASSPSRPAPAHGQPSIAVLPFADMSPQKDQDYFCEGLAEELIGALARIEGLKVAARTSAFQFKGRADDVRRIGQQLGVATVLEGSVRKAGNRLRITAQLVSAADGYQLWSERYDRDMEDVFAIQDEITATLVDTLKIKLHEHEAPRVRRVDNLEAYTLYLQGRYWWDKRHKGGLRRALDFFEKAVRSEPTYALAHAGLADANSVVGFYGFEPPREAFARAREAAVRALELDEGLAEAHVSMALIRFWFDWDWAEAEREFERAFALDRQLVTARMFFGQLLASTGRAEEADPHWQAALDHDPLSPLANGIVASGLYNARRYDAARARCRQALDLEPDRLQGLFVASMCDVHLGRYSEAIDEARRAASIAGRAPLFVGFLGMILGLAGERDEARALLTELRERSPQEYVLRFSLAWVHAGLGETEPAIDCLEQAYAEKSSLMFCLAAYREFDFLRGRPRFDALLRRMNLRAS